MTPYVLVVEDEDALATLLQYNLEKEGYDVSLAADGEEALTQVDERLPDLVVLDVDGETTILPNDTVIVRIGGEAPSAFLEKLGVRIVEKDIPMPRETARAG